MRILHTCPPMIKSIDKFRTAFADKDIELVIPEFTQLVPEEQLLEMVPTFDGWIIGDDPATDAVLSAGVAGKLKAAVKWGVGVDNVDFAAAKRLGLPITNTPKMFGEEVADVAIGLMLGLTRSLFYIDREVRKGIWAKPPGRSLLDKHVGVIGLGDIGMATVRRLKGFGVKVIGYDPYAINAEESVDALLTFPDRLGDLDIIIITCALTEETKYMINEQTISQMRDGVYLVNVSRGPLINEHELKKGLDSGKIAGAGLDVFEVEPIAPDNPLLKYDNCVFGSHNGSNTIEGVVRASHQAMNSLFSFLGI